MINSIPGSMRVTHASTSQVAHSPAVASSQPGVASPVGSEGAPVLSGLSLQLAASAKRAEVRDQTLDRQQLRVEAQRLRHQILGDAYQAQKEIHNSEIPKTTDPDLLERAKQATLHVVHSDRHDRSVKNPFAGLSREHLNFIVYDESGAYTINERRAAWYQVSDIETDWNRGLWGPAEAEKAATGGRKPGFYTEVLNHYKTLPLVEQADYPEDYETRLLANIKEDSDPSTKKPKDFELLTLFEVLAKLKAFGNQEAAGGVGANAGAAPVKDTDN
ncbi:hypothetical protein [Pseudomonas sp. DSP3-2-2]|uniref:hypothetical protein n=1 Tax=unclassified Pseudomonas TaxID=196821 RepID=UPI003CEC5EBF